MHKNTKKAIEVLYNMLSKFYIKMLAKKIIG